MAEQKEKQTYTRDFKVEAVRLDESSDKSMSEVERELGITRDLLSKWVQQTRREGGSKASDARRGTPPAPARNRRPEAGTRDFKKSSAHLQRGKAVRYEFMHAHRDEYSIQRMCAVLAVSASGYYAWCARPLSCRAQANAALLREIRAVHRTSRQTYGSPRIHAELRARGFVVSKKRLARLMRTAQIRARRKTKRKVVTTDSRHAFPVAPNRLNREFEAPRPNEKWLTDITYIPTAEGWLYLAVVMELFSRKIVGWAMEATLESSRPNKFGVEKAFQMAVQNRQNIHGLLHHSDRGGQYAGHVYQNLLEFHHLQVSMSRPGNCYDNAPMESFFGTLKNEHVHFQDYQTRSEAKTEIFAYIEGFYIIEVASN